jgi:hypothetical protein
VEAEHSSYPGTANQDPRGHLKDVIGAIKAKMRKTMKTMRLGIVPALAGILTITLLCACGDDSTTGETTANKNPPARSSAPETAVRSPDTFNGWTPQLAHAALKEKNPGYNGRGQFQIENGQVVMAVLEGTNLVNLSPLAGMSTVILDVRGNEVKDLAALRHLPLRELYLEDNPLEDLAPLQGMKLEKLYLNHTAVKDLTPLRNMPLQALNLYGTPVEDLTLLSVLPLKMLWLTETPVSDISPLSGCPLISLTLHRTRVSDLSPLSGSDLRRLHIGETPVSDLTPLRGLILTRLIFTPGRITKGQEIIRSMKSIEEIGTTFENRMPPEKFWYLYDQGTFAE